MSVLDNIQKGLSNLSKGTKKVFDTTKIEMRIKGYANEAEEIFVEIGKIIYESRNELNTAQKNKISELFNDMDNIKHRITNLEKTLTDMKKDTEDKQESIVVAGGSKNYAKLNRKDDDFIIVRTQEGISLLRFCPECSSENKSGVSQCIKCGHEFKTKKQNQ